MKKEMHFKTNTLLKNLVGKDLINDDNIGIVELVKNAYDAQSDEVLVRFRNLHSKEKDSQLIIADKGHGMSIEDIEDKWLNIAYSDKKLSEQENGAFLAGNKGVGRFSCDRLGSELNLITRVKGKELLHLRIPWKDFEVEGNKDLTIQKISLTLEEINVDKAKELSGLKKIPKSGTILVISKLRQDWDFDSLKSLRTALEKFLNPNQLFLRDAFKITLSAPEFEVKDKGKAYSEKINVVVQNQIFDKLKFNTTYIESTISSDKKSVTTELYHEGTKVFELVEKSSVYRLLDDAHISIYFLNTYKKAYFTRATGVRSVDFGSIFLFLNGFRVSPYGDRGDDWLGLDVRKAQGQQRYFGTRDIVGRIEVSGSEEQFKPISSREGLKNTAHFTQLKEDFFKNTLRKLEKFVVEGLAWDSVPEDIRRSLSKSEGLDWNDTSEKYQESWERKEQRIALSIMTLIGSSPERIKSFWFNPELLESVYETREEEVAKLIANIEGIDSDKVDSTLKGHLKSFKRLIDKRTEEAQAAKEAALKLRVKVAKQKAKINKLEGEKEIYQAQTLFFQQITSSDKKELLAFHHQISLDSITTGNHIGKAIKMLRNQPNTKEVVRLLQKAILTNKKVAAVAQFATKANFRSASKPVLTPIPTFFEQYLLNVAKDSIASGLKLEVNNKVDEPFEVKARRIELTMLIDNIISNASKAHAKKVVVSITKPVDNRLFISFVDDGKGLSKDISEVESIFDMGVTTTSGSGIGLYHVKQIIEKLDGKVIAIPNNSKGMEIKLELIK